MAVVESVLERPSAAIGRDLTWRAVAAGMVIGAVQSVANVYLALKTGIWDGGYPTAAILGFAVVTPWARRRGAGYSPHENLVTQAVAAAACAMPATAGLLGVVPALQLMDVRVAAGWIACWGALLAVFGLALGLPLRERLVTRAGLAFPTGRATAEVITAMRASGADARARAGALGLAALIGIGWTWLRDGPQGWIPAALLLPGAIAGIPCGTLTLGLGMSPMMAGTGVLVGPQVACGMLAGAVLAWGVLAPAAVALHDVATPGFGALVAWLLWPGIALMIAGAMTSLALQLPTLLARGTMAGVSATSHPLPRRLLRLARAVGVVAGAAIVLVAWRVFGVPPLLGAVVVALTGLLAEVVGRAAGQTDVTPLGPMGQLTQALAAPAARGAPAADIMTGGITGAISQSTTLAYMFRAGDDLGTPPGRVVAAMGLGALAGTVVCVPAYALIVHAYGLGTEAMPAAAARTWMALGQLATGGAGMPPHAQACAWAAGAAGVLLTLAGRGRRAWLPSPVAAGVAFLIPAHASVTIALGALAWWAIRRRWPGVGRLDVAIGSGAIAGEAVAGVAIAALLSLGLLGSR